MSVILLGSFPAFAGGIDACIATLESPYGSATAKGVGGPYSGAFVSPVNGVDLRFATIYQPGALRPMMYDAVHGAYSPTLMQFAIGAAFSLSLN